jgi:hypothetical protein
MCIVWASGTVSEIQYVYILVKNPPIIPTFKVGILAGQVTIRGYNINIYIIAPGHNPHLFIPTKKWGNPYVK